MSARRRRSVGGAAASRAACVVHSRPVRGSAIQIYVVSDRETQPGVAQAKLGGLVGKNSGWVESLPLKVQGRVEALSTIQNDYDELEDKFQVTGHSAHPPDQQIARRRQAGERRMLYRSCGRGGQVVRRSSQKRRRRRPRRRARPTPQRPPRPCACVDASRRATSIGTGRDTPPACIFALTEPHAFVAGPRATWRRGATRGAGDGLCVHTQLTVS